MVKKLLLPTVYILNCKWCCFSQNRFWSNFHPLFYSENKTFGSVKNPSWLYQESVIALEGLHHGSVRYRPWLWGGRLFRICTAVCCYNFFNEMHRIESLKLVLYQISIENNKKKYLVMLQKRFLTLFERMSLLLMSPRDGWKFLDYDENIKKSENKKKLYFIKVYVMWNLIIHNTQSSINGVGLTKPLNSSLNPISKHSSHLRTPM